MCRDRVLTFSVLALSLMATSPLWSQTDGPSGRAFGTAPGGMRTQGNFSNNEFSIIELPAVQKELVLTDEQKSKVKELCTAFQQASVPDLPPGRPMFGSAEMTKALAEAGVKAETFSREKMPELLALLTDEQKARLSEIVIQAQGFASYLRPEVQQKLGLTVEQKEQLTAIEKTFSTKLREVRAPQRGADRAARETFQKDRVTLIRERTQAVETLLTEEQRQRFEELKGKPFDQSMLLRTGPGPG